MVIATLIMAASLGGTAFSPPAALTAHLNRFGGMDRIAIEETAKAVAKQRDGLRGPVVQDLMRFAEANLNVTPPFKDAEVCVLADVADEVCRPYDSKKVVTPPPANIPKKMIRSAGDGFYLWCRPNGNDPARPIYVLGEQSPEVQSILKRQQVVTASPLPQQVSQVPQQFYQLPAPVYFGGGGCSGPACSSCR